MANPKKDDAVKPDKDNQRTDKDREHDEECLDEALEETFPASDPIAPQSPEEHH